MTWLDRYRVVPRAIALSLTCAALAICGVVAWGFVKDISDGEPTTAMTTALGGMCAALITGATATVQMLGRQETK